MSADQLGTIVGIGNYRRVEVTREVNAPVRQVWNAITNPAEAKLWAGPCEIDSREGGRIRFDSTDCEGTGKGLDGTIKVFMPPHVFEYTWNDRFEEGGLVRYDLVEVNENKTRITLVNTLNSTDYASAAAGWHEMLEKLEHSITTGEAAADIEERGRELYTLYKTAIG